MTGSSCPRFPSMGLPDRSVADARAGQACNIVSLDISNRAHREKKHPVLTHTKENMETS